MPIIKNNFVWTKNRGFITWSFGFKVYFLTILGCILSVLGGIIYFYYRFPFLCSYTFIWVFVKMYQRKLFLFYDEAYHTERQWRIIQAELTPLDRLEAKEFVDLFLQKRVATIPYKRQIYLNAKAARTKQFEKMFSMLVELERLDVERDAAFQRYRDLCAVVEKQSAALDSEMEELYQCDDKQFFYADIESPHNTVQRIIDRQLAQIKAAYQELLLETYVDPEDLQEFRKLRAEREWRAHVIEEALRDYYRQRYREVYKMALQNKRWWQSLGHLMKPSGWPEVEGENNEWNKLTFCYF